MKCHRCLFWALLFSLGSNAWAGLPVPEPLSTEPAQPRANQQFDLIYSLEFCGAGFPAYTPANRILEVSGGLIRVMVLYAGELCFPNQPYVPSYHWDIAVPVPGAYQVELWAYTAIGGLENSFPIASGEVTIAPALIAPAPNVVPATGKLGLLGLSLLTAVLAMWRLRRW